MKKKVFKFFASGAVALSALTLASCVDNTPTTKSDGSSTKASEEDKYYTVTFKNGNSETTESVEKNKTVSKPTNPTKEGYTFVGWYTDSSYNNLYDFSSKVSKDLLLYARFVASTSSEFTITLYDGDEVKSTLTTKSGLALDLPTLEAKDGASFIGWWCSSYNDKTKLTHEYQIGEELYQNTNLYAVYDNTPVVSVYSNKVVWNSLGVGKTYKLTISKDGDTKVSTSTMSTTYSYDFSEKGDYVVTLQSEDKETTVFYASKLLPSVSTYSVSGSVLTWNSVKDATSYELTISCGNASHEDEVISLDSNSYDFDACEMTSEGITFSVVSKSSGYITSLPSTYTFNQKLGTVNASISDDVLSWDSVSKASSYNVVVNGDEYEVSDTSFDLKKYSGEISYSITPKAHLFNSEETTGTYNKTSLKCPTNLVVANNVLTWDGVDGAIKYVVTIDGKTYETTANSFEIKGDFETGKTYSVFVKAIASDEANNSKESDSTSFALLLQNVKYQSGKVTWDSVYGASKYGVVINDQEEKEVTSTSFDLAFSSAKENKIKVCFYNALNEKSEYYELTVISYELSYNTNEGSNIDSVYLAEGDNIVLSDPTKTGYTFVGWYDKEVRGKKVETSTKMPSSDTVVYAYWNANKYTISYSLSTGETTEKSSVEVTYGKTFTLEVPTSDSSLGFDGWYTEADGKGIKVADYTGSSLYVWNIASDMTLYANWGNYINYEAIVKNNKIIGYKASAGKDLKNSTEVTIASAFNGLNVIELGSFAGYKKLVKINIPKTLSYIDTQTGFNNCEKLEAINVYDVEGYKGDVYYTSSTGILYYNNTLSSRSGYEVAFVPAALKGDIVIMEGCVSIPQKAFYSLDDITSVTIPSSVSYIGQQAFYYLDGLTTVTFTPTKEGVEEVGLTLDARAFYSCYALVEVTLPKRLESFYTGNITIGNYDYNGSSIIYCSKLENINVEAGCSKYKSVDGCLYSADSSTLYFVPTGKKGAFSVAGGTKVVAQNAAMSCSKLTSIFIPSSVTKIEDEAFEYCYNVTSLTIEDENTSSGLSIGKDVFYSCDLTELTLPARVKVVDSGAFANNTNLTTININCSGDISIATGVTAWSESGSSYSYVTTVNIGADCAVFDIGGAFNGANDKLASVNVDSKNVNYTSNDGVLYDKNITRIIFCPSNKAVDGFTLPSTVTAIAAGVFKNKTFTTFTIGKNITEIGDQAFYGCERLKTLTFEEDLDDNGNAKHELTIGEGAFNECVNLKSVTLPKSVKILKKYVFANCDKLETVVLNEGLESIENYAFYMDGSLTGLHIPSTLTSLAIETIDLEKNNDYTFYDCNKFETLTVSDKSTKYSVYDGILYTKNSSGNCEKLVLVPNGKAGEVKLPSTVTELPKRSFYRNERITSVVVDGTSTGFTIGSSAFYYCTNLTSISLKGATTIPEDCFYGCESLTSFEVPNTVTLIEENAFSYCTALKTVTFEDGGTKDLTFTMSSSSAYYSPFYHCGITSLTLPNRTKSIATYLFSYCNDLTDVVLPENITSIPEGTFYETKSLKNVTVSSKLTSVGKSAFYNSGITSLTLPDTVTELGDSAFIQSSLTSFVIPAGVTEISEECFNSCTNLVSVDYSKSNVKTIKESAFAYTSLTTVEISSSVENIEASAFAYCNKLTSVTFKDDSKLSSIGDYVFRNTALTTFTFPTVKDSSGSVSRISVGSGLFFNTSLTEVTLSDSITNVTGIFYGLSTLTKINISANNKYLKDENGAITNASGDTLIMVYGVVGEYYIPSTIKTISSYAFSTASKVTKVTIPATVVNVGDYVFSATSSIKEIIFDVNTTAVLGEGLFYNCSGAEKITLPNSVTELAKDYFYGCSSLVSVDTKNILSVGAYAFYNCKSLTSLDLSNATFIGEEAFYNCKSLATVTLSEDIETIDDGAFSYSGIVSINTYNAKLGTSSWGTGVFAHATKLESVTLGDQVTSIGYSMFEYCTSLKTFTFPETITSIESYAFEYSGLTSLTIPETITSVGSSVFSHCENLTTVDMSESSLTALESNMFAYCYNLTDVTLSSILESIDYYSFAYTTSLKTITLPNSLKALMYFSFAYSGIETIKIPANVEQMAGWSLGTFDKTSTGSVFYNCTKLTSIEFVGNKIDMINNSTFYGCTSLQSIILPSTVTYIGSYAFSGTALTSIDLSTVSEIGEYAFYNCKNLTSVTLGSGLEELGEETFAKTTSLTSITLPSTLTTLGKKCFTDSGLTSIDLNNVSTLSDAVFSGCKNLVSVKFNSSKMTDIVKEAFKNCSSLATLEFADDVEIKSVSASAFEGCTALTTLPSAIKDNVQTLEDLAFKNTGLTGEFVITNNLAALGKNPFAGCDVTLTVSADNTLYKIIDGSLYTVEGTLLAFNKSYNGDVLINMEVAGYAFDGCSNLNISFASDYSNVKSYMFAGLKNSTFDFTNVNTFSDYAFAECQSLSTFTFPENVKSVGEYIFKESNLETLNISTSNISAYLCRNASNLTTVNFTGEVTTISKYAFAYCTNLKTITLPSTLTKIDEYAFAYSGLELIEIPSSVTDLESYAFYTCESLTTVVIPGSITSIPSMVFAYCEALKNVTLNEGIDYIASAFYGCTSLNNVTVPSSVTKLSSTFYGCTSLSNISLLCALSQINYNTFTKTGLSSIVIDSTNLTYLDSWAFYDWTSDQTVYFTTSQESIETALDNAWCSLSELKCSVVFDYVIDSETK